MALASSQSPWMYFWKPRLNYSRKAARSLLKRHTVLRRSSSSWNKMPMWPVFCFCCPEAFEPDVPMNYCWSRARSSLCLTRLICFSWWLCSRVLALLSLRAPTWSREQSRSHVKSLMGWLLPFRVTQSTWRMYDYVFFERIWCSSPLKRNGRPYCTVAASILEARFTLGDR